MIVRRTALMLLAALALAAPAAAAPKWVDTIAATPEGGIRIGNPAAKVKLVEFASYTCSHCKAFNAVGVPALKAKYIASGKVSLEQRSFVRNGPDFAASLLVGCLAPRPALGLAEALFAEQDKWIVPFTTIAPADSQAIAMLPPEKQPARIAELTGLDGWAAKRGLPLATGRACLADKAAQDRLLAIRADAVDRYKLAGTPHFVINGKTVAGVSDWASLEPLIQAALK
ncbi:MAG: thioredoxin domain-containing protein [Sandarakinorhabdus sp.]|nr:thioredoxin domain-containing protein [Sandarakinorhabdus sp.]